MNRKWLSCLILILLLCVLPLPVMAVSPALVVDEADILTSKEEQFLADKAARLLDAYQMDAVILTIPTLDGCSAKIYAEDYYDYNGYGGGDALSGALFLLAMEEREWYIVTSGDAIYAVTDYALMRQEEQILPYLRSGEYCDGFDVWLDSLDVYYASYMQGDPVDGYITQEDPYDEQDDVVYYDKKQPAVNWLVSVAVGLAAGGITVGIMYAMMNTRRPKNSAEEYLKDNTYNLRVRKDIFLYSQVSKTRRESSSGSGNRSGSSISRGSSGRSHGGRGGRF